MKLETVHPLPPPPSAGASPSVTASLSAALGSPSRVLSFRREKQTASGRRRVSWKPFHRRTLHDVMVDAACPDRVWGKRIYLSLPCSTPPGVCRLPSSLIYFAEYAREANEGEGGGYGHAFVLDGKVAPKVCTFRHSWRRLYCASRRCTLESFFSYCILKPRGGAHWS